MYKVLSDLSNIAAVSGNERLIIQYIKKYIGEIKNKKIEIFEDTIGNIICSYKVSNSSQTTAVIANMDEPGLIVSGILENGLILFSIIGNINAELLLGRLVVFETGIKGVVIAKDGVSSKNKLKQSDLAIDIGLMNSKDCLKKVKLGEFALCGEDYKEIGQGVLAKNLKSRIPVAQLLLLAKNLARSANNVQLVFVTQQELGCRGMKVVANYLQADTIILVGASLVGNSPEGSAITRSKGFVVKVKDGNYLYDSNMVHRTVTCFAENKIAYQLELCEENQQNLTFLLDNKHIQNIVNLAIPVANIGSGGELASKSDIEELQKGLKLLISTL